LRDSEAGPSLVFGLENFDFGLREPSEEDGRLIVPSLATKESLKLEKGLLLLEGRTGELSGE